MLPEVSQLFKWLQVLGSFSGREGINEHAEVVAFLNDVTGEL